MPGSEQPLGAGVVDDDLRVVVVQLCPTLCDPMEYARLPWPSPSHGVCERQGSLA